MYFINKLLCKNTPLSTYDAIGILSERNFTSVDPGQYLHWGVLRRQRTLKNLLQAEIYLDFKIRKMV